MICSALDALDYTEKWLEDTVRYLREAGADDSGAASSDPPSLLPLNVHNHAYLRLLWWDHTSDPFPEVNPLSPQACCCMYAFFYMNPVPLDSLVCFCHHQLYFSSSPPYRQC